MMGTMFLTVLFFVNLWGYSELKAAFAITPIPLMAMLVSPVVGRLSDRLAPRAFGVPALILMAGGLWAMSGLPAEPDFWDAAWRLAIVGVGVGMTFPAVSIGSMGSIRGQELGLGSGIVNMSRQVGFAIGIALFVAVFTGVIDNRIADARKDVSKISAGLSRPQRAQVDRAAFFDPSNPNAKRTAARTPVQERARVAVDEQVRDAYGVTFRVGAWITLLAIPFSLTMRRKPSDIQPEGAPAEGRTAAAAAAAG
jgi:MFS family permease